MNNQPSLEQWETNFWKVVEEGGNGAKIEFVLKIRDFIRKVREEAKEQGALEERERIANKLWSELVREGCRLGEDGGEPVTEKEFERLPRIAKVISSLTPQKEEKV